jgi:hypothetical protein
MSVNHITRYVGVTSDIHRRWMQHFSRTGQHPEWLRDKAILRMMVPDRSGAWVWVKPDTYVPPIGAFSAVRLTGATVRVTMATGALGRWRGSRRQTTPGSACALTRRGALVTRRSGLSAAFYTRYAGRRDPSLDTRGPEWAGPKWFLKHGGPPSCLVFSRATLNCTAEMRILPNLDGIGRAWPQ